MKKLLLFVMVAVSLSIPLVSSAAEIIGKTEVLLDSNQFYEENVYVGAGKTIIESDITEDLVILAGEITINSHIAGDVFLVGGKINFNGEVDGDLRIIGAKINIDGVVHGDIVVAGGEINIIKTSVIENDVVLIGGEVSTQNNIDSELKIVAARVVLGGKISGITSVTTQNLSLNETADLHGDFSYWAPQRFFKEDGSSISGNIKFNEISSFKNTSIVQRIIVSITSFWLLLRFITTLILVFILIQVFKVFSQTTSDLALNSFWKSLFAGIFFLFLTPIIIFFLFISLVAMPIGFLLGIFAIFIGVIAPAVSGIYIGVWSRRFIKNKNNHTVNFQIAAIGVIILTLLQFIPTVGNSIRVIITTVAIGAIIRCIRLAIIK